MNDIIGGALQAARSVAAPSRSGLALAGLLALGVLATGHSAAAQSNPGDPLFCQPNEGNTFLITNGGSGVFTVDPDCFNSNINNNSNFSISTAHGSLAGSNSPGGTNYIYTPTVAGFTGLDTFTIPVTTSWNATGGPGSNGGTNLSRPGGPDTDSITLNVISADTSMNVAEDTPTLVPIPAGSVTGCGPQGNPGQGPSSTVVSGCITGVGGGAFGLLASDLEPTNGTLSISGNTLLYTPDAGFTGTDSFDYHVYGVNTDGNKALDSGDVLMSVTIGAQAANVPEPTTMWIAGMFGIALIRASRKRKAG
jgi:hypothetical protein